MIVNLSIANIIFTLLKYTITANNVILKVGFLNKISTRLGISGPKNDEYKTRIPVINKYK